MSSTDLFKGLWKNFVEIFLKYLSLTFIAIRKSGIITVEEIINKPDYEFSKKNEDGETPLYLGLINLNF